MIRQCPICGETIENGFTCSQCGATLIKKEKKRAIAKDFVLSVYDTKQITKDWLPWVKNNYPDKYDRCVSEMSAYQDAPDVYRATAMDRLPSLLSSVKSKIGGI